jgi:hypothetical protein
VRELRCLRRRVEVSVHRRLVIPVEEAEGGSEHGLVHRYAALVDRLLVLLDGVQHRRHGDDGHAKRCGDSWRWIEAREDAERRDFELSAVVLSIEREVGELGLKTSQDVIVAGHRTRTKSIAMGLTTSGSAYSSVYSSMVASVGQVG